MGLVQTPLLHAVLARIREDDVGTASGVLSTGQQVGGTLGVAIIGVLFYGALAHPSQGAASYAHAFATGLSFNLAVAVITFLLLFALPQLAREEQSHSA
jgi:hypothetical protein